MPTSTVDQLEAFYRESPNSMLGTPYPKLGNKIAITAWTGDPAKYGRDGDYGVGHIADLPQVRRGRLQDVPRRLPRQGAGGHPRVVEHPGSGPGSSFLPGQFPGYSPSVTFTVAELPFWRTILTLTVWPGLCAASTVPSASEVSVGLPVDRDDHVARPDPGLGRRRVRA